MLKVLAEKVIAPDSLKAIENIVMETLKDNRSDQVLQWDVIGELATKKFELFPSDFHGIDDFLVLISKMETLVDTKSAKLMVNMIVNLGVLGNVGGEELECKYVDTDPALVLQKCKNEYQAMIVHFLLKHTDNMAKNTDILKQFLEIVPTHVVPNLPAPLFLSDFLT